MSVYLEYLTDYDRSLMIESETIENEFRKLNTLYEMTNMQLIQLDKESELKVLTESGTYDDYEYLLTEAGNDVAQKKKGIIARIIQAIKNLFNKITGRNKDIRNSAIPENEPIEVPQDLEQKSQTLTGSVNDIKKGAAKIAQGDFSGARDILKAAIGPLGVVAIGGAVAYKQIKKRAGVEISQQSEEVAKTVNQAVDQVQSKMNNIKDQKQLDDAKECLSLLQKAETSSNSVVSAVAGGLRKAAGQKSPEKAQKDHFNRLKGNADNYIGILQKPDGKGGTYRINRTTGEIEHIPKNSIDAIKIKPEDAPDNIRKAAQQVKGRSAAKAQEEKKKRAEVDEVNAQRAPGMIFDEKKVGAKVYVNPTNYSVTINNKVIKIPDQMIEDISTRDIKKLLKENGVKKGFSPIITSIRAAKKGVERANTKQAEFDAKHAKVQRQLRTESVCESMNEILENTVYEAGIDDYGLYVIDYRQPVKISNDIITAIESEGYTVFETDEYYIIE